MQGMVVYAEQLHRDNETLVKMFKDVNLEVVDEISKDVAQEAEVAENKSQAQWSAEELGKTTQAKAIIE